jgi:hypothetical protein
MRFPAPGQAEEKDVVTALDESPFAEGGHHLRDRRWQAFAVQRRERLLRQQVRVALIARDAAAAAFLHFEDRQMAQVLCEGPSLALSLGRDLVGVATDRR